MLRGRLALLLALVLTACQAPPLPPTQPPPTTATSAGPGTLQTIATMSSPRAAHSLTRLNDGRVLIIGGFTGGERSVGDSEIFDPVQQSFNETGPMQTLRQSHSATLLPDGRVLIAGGYGPGGDYLASAEIFDPTTNAFTATGELSETRAGHEAVTLADGRVLLVGGVGTGWTFLSSAEIFDPATEAFTPTGSMSHPRESHVAVRLNDGRVLVVGGHQGRGSNIEIFTEAEIYDPSTGAFTDGGQMNIRRHKHAAVLLADGRVLVSGGSNEDDFNGRYTSAEIYDPVAGTFTLTGEMKLPRHKHAGTTLLLSDGRVLIAGGAAQAEIFDPVSETFSLVEGEANMGGNFSAATLLGDGQALVSGGYGQGSRPLTQVWLYQP